MNDVLFERYEKRRADAAIYLAWGLGIGVVGIVLEALSYGSGDGVFVAIGSLLAVILTVIAALIYGEADNLHKLATAPAPTPQQQKAAAAKTAENIRVKKIRDAAEVMGVPAKHLEQAFYRAKHTGVKEAFSDIQGGLTDDSYVNTLVGLADSGFISKTIMMEKINSRDPDGERNLADKAKKLESFYSEFETWGDA
jgi:hypothetical protein